MVMRRQHADAVELVDADANLMHRKLIMELEQGCHRCPRVTPR